MHCRSLSFCACLLAAFFLASISLGDEKPRPKSVYDEIDQYREVRVEGWKVLVYRKFQEETQRELGDKTLKLLERQLYDIGRAVPAAALAKLRAVPIWVEVAHPRHPCMCYHTSADWLREHGMNPKKAGAVEIANAKNFLIWTLDQPWMVLHELAHAYHDQVLGFENVEVKACFDRAVTAKNYETVLDCKGRKRRHYALTNAKEYFAEASEAYFGTNDFFPFVRAELKQHDPAMFELLAKLWGTSGAPGKR